MTKSRSYCCIFLLAIFFWGFTSASIAQNQIIINEANRIEGGTVEDKKVQKIIGDVHLRTEEMEVFCDSAYQFTNENEVRAFGNIQINTEDEKIWADSLTYFTDVDFSQLRGRVIIETDSVTLFGNSVDYRFSTKVGHFTNRVRLEDQQGTLLANSGFYYREADSAVFRGEVQIADTLQYLEGDSLFSNRTKKYYEVHGNVFADDSENNTMLKTDYLEADSAGNRLLRGSAWLKSFETDTTDSAASSDTTHIRAQTIHSIQNRTATDTTTIVNAYQNVRIWSPNFAAVADTSRYDDRTGYFELWSNAIAWHKQVQLTGPYINAKLVDGDIDSLISYPNPFSVQQDTTIDRLNQITGDTLEASFSDGELHEIYVYRNARLLRFTKDEAGNPDGAINLTAPSVRILFKDGELVKMKALGQSSKAIDGSYLPENEKTAKRTLDGFSWNPERRPQRPTEKMEPRFSPVPAVPFFDLPPRYVRHLKQKSNEYLSQPITGIIYQMVLFIWG